MNFVAILSALDALATGSVEKADPKRYESLPMNETRMFHILVKNATIVSGAGVRPFLADIGIQANRRVRSEGGRRQVVLQTNINDLGDLRTSGAFRVVDARGLIAAPLWDASLKEGQEIGLPDFSTTPSPRLLAPGQPGEIVLLRPQNGADRPSPRYIVDTILK